MRTFAVLALGFIAGCAGSARQSDALDEKITDLVIYGCTPAGLTAAITAKSHERSVVLLCPVVARGAIAVRGRERVVGDSVTGVILTKMDGDARGGAALSVRQVTGVPIKFISVGEKMKDLDPFHPDRLAKRILDMGDVLSLVEKAEEAINQDEAMGMMKNLERGRFTINDFVKQMESKWREVE